MFTPLTATGKSSTIEDFFHKSVRQQKLGGKSFNPGKPFDSATQYGKVPFAEKIVRPQRKTIDFAKFGPILSRFSQAITDYAQKTP